MDQGLPSLSLLHNIMSRHQFKVDLKSLAKLEFTCHNPKKDNELVGIYNNLIQPQIYPRLKGFMNGSFLQTSTEVSTPLTANKSKKKEAGEK